MNALKSVTQLRSVIKRRMRACTAGGLHSNRLQVDPVLRDRDSDCEADATSAVREDSRALGTGSSDNPGAKKAVIEAYVRAEDCADAE